MRFAILASGNGSNFEAIVTSFENQELKVEAVEVSVGTTGFAQDNNSESNLNEQGRASKGRSINLNGINVLDEDLLEEEQIEVEMMKADGRSVDYIA